MISAMPLMPMPPMPMKWMAPMSSGTRVVTFMIVFRLAAKLLHQIGQLAGGVGRRQGMGPGGAGLQIRRIGENPDQHLTQ